MEEENKKNQEKQEVKPEEEKQVEKPAEKDGIAKLKEIGLKEVSNKTFINLENLTALLDKDFAKLNKTKAMGFIQILQREFDVDLNDLKNDYLHFNNSDRRVEKDLAKVQKQNTTVYVDEEPTKWFSYLLLALAALVGGYFLFTSGGNGKSVSAVDLNVVKNDVVIEKAKESLITLDKVYEEETNESDEVDLNKVVEKMFSKIDENESLDEDENITTAIVLDINESKVPAMEEKIVLEENNTLETLEKAEVLPVVSTPIEKVKKPKVKKVQNSNRGGLFIEPIQKAWVGVIFLDSMRKKDFLIYDALQLDANKDQIILVGHKNFKIFNKQLEIGFKSKQKVMFLYKDGELREISKREYNKYRGSTRW